MNGLSGMPIVESYTKKFNRVFKMRKKTRENILQQTVKCVGYFTMAVKEYIMRRIKINI